MAKRRRSSSAESTGDSVSSRLRPKDGLRRPDRLAYGNPDTQDPSKNVKKERKAHTKRFKWPPPPLDLYSENRFTWKQRPKFLEYSAPIDGISGVYDAGGDARPGVGASDCSASLDCAASDFSFGFIYKTKSNRNRPAAANNRDASIYRQLQEETRGILTRMYMEDAPSDFGIPSWFWGHLRPCDRFLLLKRLFVVDLAPLDAAVINGIDNPNFSDAKKIVKNLTQLQIVVSPDAAQTNSMRIPNICARLFEVHDKVRHPRRSRKLQDARTFSVTVDKRNHGRLNFFLSGESFALKLWTDDQDFSRFVGHYQREVFPSVMAEFRASVLMEDYLTRDEDFLASKKMSIQSSFRDVV